ncbi:MAG: pacearchaeosortase [Candidatus Pacearchaeota archaeon]
MRIFQAFLRYLLVALVALPGLAIFYSIFKPLTVHPSYWIFDLIFQTVSLERNSILIGSDFVINIINSCVAGSAYYLLFALNMSVPNKGLKKRSKMIGLGFLALLLLNLLRIFLLGSMFASGSSESLFDASHKAFWLLGSTVFVVAIWFTEVKIFNIKEIPVYTDIKHSLKLLKDSKNYG